MDDFLLRYRPYLAMTLLFVLVLIGTILFLRRQEPVPLAITTPTPRPSPTTALLIVDVRGAVSKPGVYTLTVGSRVQDVLALAGDLLSNADPRALNLARKLNDGEQIYIPVVGEATPAPPTAAPKSTTTSRTPTVKASQGKINLNTATLDELDVLPGIGPAIAQRILDYRAQTGDFKKIDEIKNVRGIGDAMFEQIKDLITTQ